MAGSLSSPRMFEPRGDQWDAFLPEGSPPASQPFPRPGREMTIMGQPGLDAKSLKEELDSIQQDMVEVFGAPEREGWTTGQKVTGGLGAAVALLGTHFLAKRLGIKIPGGKTARAAGAKVASVWGKIPPVGRTALGFGGSIGGFTLADRLLSESPEITSARDFNRAMGAEAVKRKWAREDEERLLTMEQGRMEQALRYNLAMRLFDSIQAREQAKTDLAESFMDRYYQATQQQAANLAAILAGAR